MNFEENGFEIHTNFLDNNSITEVINDIEALDITSPKHGIRNAEKKLVTVQKLVESSLLLQMAEKYLTGHPKVVRVIVFDKTPEKNWFVTWHQDKTISVSHKQEINGWSAWTLKDGIHHVQPTLAVLEDMITFRIHLDDTNEDNGCLKVIPKSHKLGILDKNKQDKIVAESEKYMCVANAGDLLIMRPHLLHASSKGIKPSRRRIIHIEYSSFQLPAGLAWT